MLRKGMCARHPYHMRHYATLPCGEHAPPPTAYTSLIYASVSLLFGMMCLRNGSTSVYQTSTWQHSTVVGQTGSRNGLTAAGKAQS